MRITLRRVDKLGERDRAPMCALLDRYFLGVDRRGFEEDLANKDYAVLLHDRDGSLAGFTTLAFDRIPGTTAGWVLYSGDTIVDRSGRTSPALAAGWIDSVERLRAELGAERLVWLLICSSVRTYRFLPLFFRDFAPHPKHSTSQEVQDELDRLARARYGPAYDTATGVVTLARPQPLRREPVESTRLEGEIGAFFERLNPGHRKGDELVCHTVVTESNLTAAGRRMLARAAAPETVAR